MKSTTIIALSAATLAAAQGNSSLSSLPTCGQYCINSLITIVQQAPYNCPNNPTCFCCKPDFGFGIRDCANESCGSGSNDANSAIAYAASYCASALPTESSSACASFGGSSASSTGSGSAASASVTGSSPASGSAGGAQATGAAGFIHALNGGASGYSIASTTATAGGPEVTVSGTEYSALPSDGGVVATASGATTTIPASALTGGAAASSGSGSGSGAGALGFIAPVDGGSSGYSIASTTITAGGAEATLSNTEYSALPSAGGVVATASGLTTTYAESQLGGAGGAAGATGSSSGAPMSQPTSSGTGAGGAGGAGGSGSSSTSQASVTAGGAASSSSSGGAGAIITAAPVMVGAAALAVFAL